MDAIYNQTQKCFNFTYMEFLTDYNNSMLIVSWVTFTFALPVICVAMYGLDVLMRTDHVTSVYLVNLLVSDVLQICIRPVLHMVSPQSTVYAVMIFSYVACMMVNVCFMMCIAAERYLMVVFPVWYRFHRKRSVCLSCIVWLLPVITMPISSMNLIRGGIHCSQFMIGCVIFYLLPYPLVVFFFVGTWRALSKSTPLSSQEQRWIMGTLALVLCIYTMCFMPFIVSMIIYTASGEYTWKAYMLDTGVFCNTLLCINPLFDPLLYVFMRKDAKDILEAFPCCHCDTNDQPESPAPLATVVCEVQLTLGFNTSLVTQLGLIEFDHRSHQSQADCSEKGQRGTDIGMLYSALPPAQQPCGLHTSHSLCQRPCPGEPLEP